MERFEAKYVERWINLGAWWEHSGNPRDPHVILSGKDHSTLYMNNGHIAQKDPALYHDMMMDLVATHPYLARGGHVDFVVAPAVGGVQMAFALALAIGSVYGIRVEQYFTDKVIDADGNVIDMVYSRGAPRAGALGLVFDDVTTTHNAIQLCAEATLRAEAVVVGAGTTLNRSPDEALDLSCGNLVLHSLVRKHVKNMHPVDCTLCAQGSTAHRPKELWNQITAPA